MKRALLPLLRRGFTMNPTHKPKQKAKARLVILGFEDPLIDQIPRDSPTLSRDARMLATAVYQQPQVDGWIF